MERVNSVIRKRAAWGTACLMLPTLLGCASQQVVTPPNSDPVLTGDYVIGPGDQLNIDVWNNPDVSATVPVRPDGKISSPLVTDLVAVGKTPRDLAAEIETILSEYIRSPQVTVIVTDFVGPYNQQIRVIGQAVEPQALPYREGMTVLDVIIAVGGLDEFAAGNRAQIVRTVDGEETSIRVRLDNLLNRGRMNENIEMRPGDVLLIPESRF